MTWVLEVTIPILFMVVIVVVAGLSAGRLLATVYRDIGRKREAAKFVSGMRVSVMGRIYTVDHVYEDIGLVTVTHPTGLRIRLDPTVFDIEIEKPKCLMAQGDKDYESRRCIENQRWEKRSRPYFRA